VAWLRLVTELVAHFVGLPRYSLTLTLSAFVCTDSVFVVTFSLLLYIALVFGIRLHFELIVVRVRLILLAV